MKNLRFLLFMLLFFFAACEKDTSDACNSLEVSLNPAKTNYNVLIIGIDGFRSDVLNTSLTPFMFSLSQAPNTYFNNEHQIEYYTSSGPNWTSILTGVHWEKHQVVDNFFSGYDPYRYPSIFHYIETANPDANTTSICHWLPINSVIIGEQADFAPVSLYSDSAVYVEALHLINQSSLNSSDVIFLHFDDLDHYGHAFGYHENIPEYATALSKMDNYTEGLFQAVHNKRIGGEEWLVCIISDHGGEGREHSNMPDVPTVTSTIFFVNLPGANLNFDHSSSQVDLSPTVLDFLGIESQQFNCYTQGISLIK